MHIFPTKIHKKVENLQKKHPEKVKILARNDDGTILCKLPIKSLKLSIIERELTEEQRKELSKKFKERLGK